jgi:hypothetical protein
MQVNLLPTNEELKKIMKIWLILGISALAAAGFFSILIVMLRTPGIQNVIPLKDFFHTSLVVHVDLSVLVWMLSICGMLWCKITSNKYSKFCRVAVNLAIIGTFLITISAFVNDSKPLMNNYVPVLQNLPFFLGLSFFLCGITIQVLITLISYQKQNVSENQSLYFSIYTSSIITLIAILSFLLSYYKIKEIKNLNYIDIQFYYELLFWGGGHILQFTYTQASIIAWVILYNSISNTQLNSRFIKIASLINLAAVIPSLTVYTYGEIDDGKYHRFFTEHMKYLGGIAPSIIGTQIFINLLKDKKIFASSYLVSSLILFFVGGGIALLIMGTNVVIPAHYHGSIVGITLALMGLALIYLKDYGLNPTSSSKIYKLQPYLYGGGQLLHILGLAWSGGYGALRKTPGAAPSFEAQLGMGLMGFGGLLAIIGGLIYVVVSYRSFYPKK